MRSTSILRSSRSSEVISDFWALSDFASASATTTFCSDSIRIRSKSVSAFNLFCTATCLLVTACLSSGSRSISSIVKSSTSMPNFARSDLIIANADDLASSLAIIICSALYLPSAVFIADIVLGLIYFSSITTGSIPIVL